MDIELRSLSLYEEFKSAERVQAVAFGFEPLDIVPYMLMQSFATSGGIVVGAFDAEQMTGVVMGYTGLLRDGTPYHRSQRLAVLPEYRGQGIGIALKLKQAELARQRGLNQMRWTFDPLRAVNANLNIHKLGATSSSYMARYYAAPSGKRDAGTSIDRLLVEWDLGRAMRDNPAIWPESAQTVVYNERGVPSQPELKMQPGEVIIQIPDDIDAVRDNDPDGVAKWRQATASAFQFYFAHGYRVVDYMRHRGYLLSAFPV